VRLIDDLNREPLAFVIHDGDFKNGSSRCDDAIFFDRLELFQRSRHPFIYLPGDNEWTDCHRWLCGDYDPLERLQRLREIFFAGDASLGHQAIRLDRQSEAPNFSLYRENVRWSHAGVVFVGLHVVGSNNNRGRTARMDLEYDARNLATIAWMRQSFAAAKAANAPAIVLAMQAPPSFSARAGAKSRSGFYDLYQALVAEVIAFKKPVLLVHGDEHRFRLDHPLRDPVTGAKVSNFTRVETFGTPRVNWVRLTIDPSSVSVFSIAPGAVKPRPR
jgi:hypothetical protein